MAETAAIITAVMATQSYIEAQDARSEQASAARRVQSEQTAANTAAAATERRNQIREERVRRARILQSSRNTGTQESSGEFGSIGGMSTQLSSNIGSNLGALQSAGNISTFQQQGADAALKGQNASSMFQLSTSIFGAVGGPEQAVKLMQ